MRHQVLITIAALAVGAAAGDWRGNGVQVVKLAEAAGGSTGSEAGDKGGAGGNVFELKTTANETHGAKASKIKPSKTEAAMRLFVVEKDKGPVKGVVIALTAPDGAKYFTEETDADGYGEALVPVGQKYEMTYLALGRKDVAASVTVTSEPNQNIKLTLRFKRLPPPPPFVLTGVVFDTGATTIKPESYPRLDLVVEFMVRKKSARIAISGHTDNVGNKKKNKTLSQNRAEACRDYVAAKGIDKSRMTAIGFGDERPIAPNDSDENRQKNRRIEAVEIVPPQ